VSYYLLNHLSTGVLIVVIVGVPTVAALVVVWVVEGVFVTLRDLEMDDAVRDVVGSVFGLLLALVIASIVTKQDDAESAAAAESTAAAQLARATRGDDVVALRARDVVGVSPMRLGRRSFARSTARSAVATWRPFAAAGT
jgi:hypothetical protein